MSMWYKSAVFYELHVKAFFDSDNDGIGDFKGLIQKLDYIEALGTDCILLLPFYPSPGRNRKDDDYDITNYCDVNQLFGTLADFREFISEAHQRNLKVVIDLLLNHTSDKHPWFFEAQFGPEYPCYNYYVWSKSPEKYQRARVLFPKEKKSNWTRLPGVDAFYWHRFHFYEPELNYDNPAVHYEMFKVVDFWLDIGVDGFRLDSVPYLYEREGTRSENLPETHQFLKKLREYIDSRYQDKLLLAEVTQWVDEAAGYFGKGDECQMATNYPLMPRIFLALRREERAPIEEFLSKLPQIPETCQWGSFLRNYDDRTLEMVTDRRKDYLFSEYAKDEVFMANVGTRRRLAPLVENSRRRIELLNGLLFSLPGSPIIYYGDEIGMGDNPYLGPRAGVRTPMQWNMDKNAGFTKMDYDLMYNSVIRDSLYSYMVVNVEAQDRIPTSLLNWMRRLITIRKQYPAFSQGDLQLLYPENDKILVFIRRYEDEHLLVACNLSRFIQPVELDLSAYAGWRPVDLFGGIKFPRIENRPYMLTFGPHNFFWFKLEPENES